MHFCASLYVQPGESIQFNYVQFEFSVQVVALMMHHI